MYKMQSEYFFFFGRILVINIKERLLPFLPLLPDTTLFFLLIFNHLGGPTAQSQRYQRRSIDSNYIKSCQIPPQ